MLTGAIVLAVTGGATRLPGQDPAAAGATEPVKPIIAIEGRIHGESVVIEDSPSVVSVDGGDVAEP